MNESHLPIEKPPQLIIDLRERREALAEASARTSMFRSLSHTDRIGSEQPSVLTKAPVDMGYDCGVVMPTEFLAIEANGADTRELIENLGSKDRDSPIFQLHSGNELVKAYAYGQNGLTLRKETVAGTEDSADFDAAVTKRYQESPAHRAVHDMVGSFNGDYQSMPSHLVSEPFEATADPLASLIFLHDIGLANTTYVIRDVMDGKDVTEVLQHTMQQVAQNPEKILTNDDDMTLFRWGREAKSLLKVNKHTGEWTFSMSVFPEDAYPEIANQTSDIVSEPFIETACARDLASWLEAHDLTFSDQLSDEMVRIGDADRYGAVYTQMTREVAKWIMSEDRISVGALFKAQGESDLDEDAQEVLIREKFESADLDSLDMSEPARILLAMAQQAVRSPRLKNLSDLPVAHGDIKLRDSSCFDVAAYYVGAADLTQAGVQTGLVKTDIETEDGRTLTLLDKLHGGKTTLSTQPLTFNGVDVPKGSLFMRQEDGSYAFLRLTPFTFDSPEDQRAFGSEMDKMYQQQTMQVRSIGGAALNNLIQAAR